MPRPVPLWAATPLAVVGGLLLTLAFPAWSWWPTVFLALPIVLTCLIGRRVGGALLVGFAFAAAFFSTNVAFTARYLGPVPWIALSVLEAALLTIVLVAVSLCYRWVPRILPGLWASWTVLPMLVAGLWTTGEIWIGSWPYGGFPWGRLGISQVSGPFAPVASWIGVSGLSFLVALVAALLVAYLQRRRWRDLRPAVAAVALVAVMVVVPASSTSDAGSITVGSAQGNGPAGYFDERSRGDVFRAQLTATRPLLDEEMDVVLWPEGSIDTDLNDPAVASVLDEIAARTGAQLVLNMPGTQRGDELFNTSIVWDEGEGITQTYDKTHPVPFGEYVPDRWFFEPLAPDLIGLIQREYTPGTTPPVFDLDGVAAGLAICFDVIYDDVIRAGIDHGAEVFLFQTNNADFRGTDENLQQLAIARMRAIETGRAVVNISTVGTSQVIAADGSVIEGIGADEQGAMLTEVPLHTGRTGAMVVGEGVQIVLGWGSLGALLVLGAAALVRRTTARAADTPR